MKFDQPAGANPIDQLKVVGQPHDRIDGPLKKTGTAPYAYEWHNEVPNVAYGYIVGSAIAKGRIDAIDVQAASGAPGVLAVVTADNAGRLGKGDKNTAALLGGPEIAHYHQAIALVVAETFEQARAALTLDATYSTPDQSHMAMEPHASMAVWEGDNLTVWTSNQMIDWCRTDLAKTLKLPVAKVRIISPYIGGGVRREAVFALRRAAGGPRSPCDKTAGKGDTATTVDCE